jgi:histone-lysine N-methyltransferase SETMAR
VCLCALKWLITTIFNKIVHFERTMLRLQANGEQAIKKTTMKKWYAEFRDGQQSIHDEKLCGRTKIVTSNHVTVTEELLDNDRHIKICEKNKPSDCNIGTIHRIIHEGLNMRRMCARWVPKMLTDEKKIGKSSVLPTFSQRNSKGFLAMDSNF